LGWIQEKYVMRITKRRITKFVIDVDYVDEVLECEFVPLDACEVMFGNPYLWDRDATIYEKEKKISFG